ncbi:MAG: zinc metallopeptidase [Lewinella sp.]|jgi:Zn-dependent membrane protease YugP|uniref:zinc metallopeptidase n=1 Tax=Lewinella sp. TaxID=2004506 RepID=UPI003D6AF4AD
MGYIVIVGIFSFIGMLVSNRLKSKFRRYSNVPLSNGRSGAEVAQTMLEHYGIHDVKIAQGQGMLTDHYNPATKTVSLSPEVFHGRHVAAAAVAAHECGHAVQHNTAYAWLKFRSAMVPAVSLASKAQQYLLLFALGMFGVAGSNFLLYLTIAAFGITTLFSLVTLPVEFDASNRALAWLEESNYTRGSEHEGAKDALWWAATTYVVAALSSLVVLLYLIMSLAGRD